MSDPTPLGDGLAEARRALAGGRGPGSPPPLAPVPLDPDDGEDPEEIEGARAYGLERSRAIRWGRVAPSRFSGAQLSDFAGRPFYDDLREWAENPGGRNLVLFGPIGVGKSRAALSASRVAHDRGLEVRYYLVAEALDLLRPGGPEDALDALSNCDRLILDDLGSERPTDWTAERLGILIDRRWRDERPLIVTTNLELDRDDAKNELLAAVGQRSYSRLVGDGALVLRLTGADRRRNP